MRKRPGIWLKPPITTGRDQTGWRVRDDHPSEIDRLVKQYRSGYPEGDLRQDWIEQRLRGWWRERTR
jgi:hypothetical protein